MRLFRTSEPTETREVMQRKELRTGVVYAWSSVGSNAPRLRPQEKCVFVDLDTVRTATQPRLGAEDQRVIIRQSDSHEKHWGSPPMSVYGHSGFVRRGYLAVTGLADADDSELLAQAEKLRSRVPSPETSFRLKDGSPIDVVAPREVYATWEGYLAAVDAQRTASQRASTRFRAQRAAGAEAGLRIQRAFGDSVPMPRDRFDGIEVSAAWLADLLEGKLGEQR